MINHASSMEFDSETENVTRSTYMEEEMTNKQIKNSKNMMADSPHKNLSEMIGSASKNIVEEILHDLLNPFNWRFLIKKLNAARVEDEKLIPNSAKRIMVGYPEIEFKKLLDGVMYRLVILSFKKKKQNKINKSLLAIFNNTTHSKSLKVTGNITVNQSKSRHANDTVLPQSSDLRMPHVDKLFWDKIG